MQSTENLIKYIRTLRNVRSRFILIFSGYIQTGTDQIA